MIKITEKNQDRLKNATPDTIRQGWVNQLAPDFAWPWLQLMRADRPVGVWLLLWPCWWSLGLAGHVYSGDIGFYLPPFSDFLLFAVGAFVMRGAGCVINDLADQKYDVQVERTRNRPLASGRISRRGAFVFLFFLCLIGLMILAQFNGLTRGLGAASLILVVLYPFMKRITYWPQIFLGLTLNWGALMGWTSVSGTLSWAAFLLYLGGLFWTLGYDTIYAHQDKTDDMLIGVKSTALRLGDQTHKWLVGFYGLMLLSWGGAGYMANIGGFYYVGLIAVGLQALGQVKKLDITDSANCLKRFQSNYRLGLILFLALILGQF